MAYDRHCVSTVRPVGGGVMSKQDSAQPADYAHHNEDAERIYYEEHRYSDPSEYEHDDWYGED